MSPLFLGLKLEDEMFQIGDRVRSKNSEVGPTETEMTVIGIYPAKSYRKAYYVSVFENWNKYYPNWEKGTVIFLRYLVPNRGISFKQFKNWYSHILNEEELKKQYEAIPLRTDWAQPEQNLELVSE